MRDLLILAIHLVVTFAKLLRPGGARTVAAEALQECRSVPRRINFAAQPLGDAGDGRFHPSHRRLWCRARIH